MDPCSGTVHSPISPCNRSCDTFLHTPLCMSTDRKQCLGCSGPVFWKAVLRLNMDGLVARVSGVKAFKDFVFLKQLFLCAER